MKYIVAVNGRRHEVTIGADGVGFNGQSVTAHLADIERTPMAALSIADAVHGVRVRRVGGRGRYTLWIDGYRFEVEALDERTRAIRDLDIRRETQAGPAVLTAPMPGLIVRVLVREGDEVQAGQGLVVVEAMKMENELRATAAGRVKGVRAVAGMAVEKGAMLVELEAT